MTGDWEESPSLSLSLEIFSDVSQRFVNLTTGMSYTRKGKKSTIFVTISDRFINSMQIIGKAKLIKSMKSGLVHQVKKGTFSHLEDSLAEYLDDLPLLPEQESSMLNSFELPKDFISNPFWFFENSRQAQFERQLF